VVQLQNVKAAKTGDGKSRSATARRLLNTATKDGTFVLNGKKAEKFEKTIRGRDAKAIFEYHTKHKVQHSACKQWLVMKEPYNTSRFSEHLKTCLDRKTQGVLFEFGARRKETKPTTDMEEDKASDASPHDLDDLNSVDDEVPRAPLSIPTRPCYGLKTTSFDNIKAYLSRTGAEGGGARSLREIARKRFCFPQRTPRDIQEYGNILLKHDLQYRELPEDAQEEINVIQSKELQWRNVRGHGAFPSAVFSAQCTGVVTGSDADHPVCEACMGLWKNRRFRQAVKVSTPDDEDRKFNTKKYKRTDDMSVFAQNSGLAKCFDEVCNYILIGLCSHELLLGLYEVTWVQVCVRRRKRRVSGSSTHLRLYEGCCRATQST
jgi:hypothetical protein